MRLRRAIGVARIKEGKGSTPYNPRLGSGATVEPVGIRIFILRCPPPLSLSTISEDANMWDKSLVHNQSQLADQCVKFSGEKIDTTYYHFIMITSSC
jgi:hypothetical protein